MYGAMRIGVMLGPIKAIEVASTSTNVSEPARRELGAPAVSSIDSDARRPAAEFPRASETSPLRRGRTVRGEGGADVLVGHRFCWRLFDRTLDPARNGQIGRASCR